MSRPPSKPFPSLRLPGPLRQSLAFPGSDRDSRGRRIPGLVLVTRLRPSRAAMIHPITSRAPSPCHGPPSQLKWPGSKFAGKSRRLPVASCRVRTAAATVTAASGSGHGRPAGARPLAAGRGLPHRTSDDNAGCYAFPALSSAVRHGSTDRKAPGWKCTTRGAGNYSQLF
jgi:hypothetical protein